MFKKGDLVIVTNKYNTKCGRKFRVLVDESRGMVGVGVGGHDGDISFLHYIPASDIELVDTKQQFVDLINKLLIEFELEDDYDYLGKVHWFDCYSKYRLNIFEMSVVLERMLFSYNKVDELEELYKCKIEYLIGEN